MRSEVKEAKYEVPTPKKALKKKPSNPGMKEEAPYEKDTPKELNEGFSKKLGQKYFNTPKYELDTPKEAMNKKNSNLFMKEEAPYERETPKEAQQKKKLSIIRNKEISEKEVKNYLTPTDDGNKGIICPVCKYSFDYSGKNINRLPYKYPCSHIACMDCIIFNYEAEGISTCCLCFEKFDLAPQDFKIDKSLYDKYSKIEQKASEIKRESIKGTSKILEFEEEKYKETPKEAVKPSKIIKKEASLQFTKENPKDMKEKETPYEFVKPKKTIDPAVCCKIMTTNAEKEERSYVLSTKFLYENQEILKEEKELTKLIIDKDVSESKIKEIYQENKYEFNEKSELIFRILDKELKSDNINLIVTNKAQNSNLASLSNLSSDYNVQSFGLLTTYPDSLVSFKDLEENVDKRIAFESKYKRDLAKTLGIEENRIKILSLSQGSTIVACTIIRQLNQLNVQQLLNDQEVNEAFDKIRRNPNFPLTRLMPNKTFRLCPSDFDPRGNFHFPKPNGDIQMRGGLIYYQPNDQWERIGLRVLDRFPDDGWLKMDGNQKEWAVAFHGVRNNVNNIVPIIMKQGLQKGGAQAYQEIMCRVFKGNRKEMKEKCGKGIYCTPKIEIAMGYTNPVKIGNDVYRIVFQCRVRPTAIRVPENQEDYWIIQQSDDIRPYGICLKKN